MLSDELGIRKKINRHLTNLFRYQDWYQCNLAVVSFSTVKVSRPSRVSCCCALSNPLKFPRKRSKRTRKWKEDKKQEEEYKK